MVRKFKAPVAMLLVLSLLLTDLLFTTNAGYKNYVQAGSAELNDSNIESIVKNGGFEQAGTGTGAGFAKDWRGVSYQGAGYEGAVQFSLDSLVRHGGNQSAKMAAEGPQSRGVIDQSIPVTTEMKGKTYTLIYYMKTENATKATARIQFYNGNTGMSSVQGGMIQAGAMTSTQDWTAFKTDFTMLDHPDVTSFRTEFFLEKGVGTVWLDDVSVTLKQLLGSIEFEEPQYTIPAIGNTIQLGIRLVPDDAENSEIVWSSSDPDTIAVTQNGGATALRQGAAIITAAAKDGSVQASVTVYAGENGENIVASDDVKSILQGEIATGQMNATHHNNAVMSYSVLARPDNGVAAINEQGQWSYEPTHKFHGTDNFSIIAADGAGSYAVSHITITVTKKNEPPAVEDSLHSVNKGTVVNGKISASDPDKDALVYTMDAGPEHGTASLQSNGNYTYTPDAGYTGLDFFAVHVSDGKGGQAKATVYIYMTPAANDIIQLLSDENAPEGRAHLLAKAEDFVRIQNLLNQSDENMENWLANVIRTADNLLTQPVVVYAKPDGLRLDTSASSHIVTLSFAYRLTGEGKYLNRAWAELNNVSSSAYPDWSPEHFLDTAMTTYGVAVGYDLLYEQLTEAQREQIRTAIVNKGLMKAKPIYSNAQGQLNGWALDKNNWNFVCNAGMIAGAVAVAHRPERQAISGEILHGAFKSLQYGLRQYAPDGASLEGPAYWEYGTSYLVYLLAILQNAFGQDFGFSEYEGIKETPDYPLYITGTEGAFNYADNDQIFIPGRLLLWFAKRFNEPGYAWYHQFSNAKADKAGLYDMLWYDPSLYNGSEPNNIDYYFSRQQAMTMRSSWNDPNALFAGFKGGINGTPHGDLDIGTFVLDALGVRWAIDLGKEDYNLPGYWDRAAGSARWTYYRKKPEGQNTIVINPSHKLQQATPALSPIIAREENGIAGAYAIADMTEAYESEVLLARRGLSLQNYRREFIVQDEITARSASELYWFMHTDSEIEVQSDGRTAILHKDGKRLWVQLLTPQGEFSVMNAAPLPASPNPNGQNGNAGIKKLTVHLQNTVDATIAIRMVPLLPGQSLPQDTPAVVPLGQWSVQEHALATLQSIEVDGQPLGSFDERRFVYHYEMEYGEPIPQITAVPANSDHMASVNQIADGVYRIEVTDPSGSVQSNEYFIQFTIKETINGAPSTLLPLEELPNAENRLAIQSVKASGHDGNLPENVLDDSFATRWSDEGTSWLLLDLGEDMLLQQAAIAWFNGNKRSTFFDIEVSRDGYNWEWVYNGKSSGITTELETYPLRESEGRYVRIKAYGNTANAWNSITKLQLYGESTNN